jgi:hypothetical protein
VFDRVGGVGVEGAIVGGIHIMGHQGPGVEGKGNSRWVIET